MPDPAAIFEQRIRIRAGLISLGVGASLMAAKFLAYYLTGSAGVLTDALESIVNVAAAAFLVGSVVFAGLPADRNHPYGHGKIEFFAAAFEGGLITFAALASFAAAAHSLWKGPSVTSIDQGLWITGAAGAVNLVLGLFLVKIGRQYKSVAIEADGRHVLSDTLTTAVLLFSLTLVKYTGLAWFDPACAIALGLILAFAGLKLVRAAAGGLLDEYDPETIQTVLSTIDSDRNPGLIRVHHLRALRFGARTHVDAHLVMPEFWPLDRAHALCDAAEQKLQDSLGSDVDVMFHSDPCRRLYCCECEVDPCPIRQAPFSSRSPLTSDEAERTDQQIRAAVSALPGNKPLTPL